MERLSDLGLEVIPSVTNYVLCHLPKEGPTAANTVTQCRRQGLFLRDVSAMGKNLGPHALRVAVKDALTNDRMAGILGNVLKEGESAPSIGGH